LKLHTKTVCAEPVPQPSFGFGKVGVQSFGASSRFDVPFQTPPSPCPLPLKGERGSGRHALTPFESVRSVNA
jgi:hypothetical protein